MEILILAACVAIGTAIDVMILRPIARVIFA